MVRRCGCLGGGIPQRGVLRFHLFHHLRWTPRLSRSGPEFYKHWPQCQRLAWYRSSSWSCSWRQWSNFVRNIPVHPWWTAGSGLPVSSGLDLQHRGSQHWASWMACMAKVNSGLFDCMVYSHDKNKRPQIDVLVIPGMLLSKLLMAATSRRAFTLLVVADILRTIGTSWDQDQFNYLALADTSLLFPFEEPLRTDWMAEQAKGTPYCTSGKESSLIW